VDEEKQEIIKICNGKEDMNLPPSQIVPALADQGFTATGPNQVWTWDITYLPILLEGVTGEDIVLHSDNGSPMKGATMFVTLQNLGVIPSFRRPSVSNDNPYSESLFKTLRYSPIYPSMPFDSMDISREWVLTLNKKC